MRVAGTAELLGNYEEAEKTLREFQAAQLESGADNLSLSLPTKRSIARLLGEKGDLFQSEKMYREILTEAKKPGADKDTEVQALLDVSDACLEGFRIIEAEDFAQKAYAMRDQASPAKLADVLETCGSLQLAKGNISDGEDFITQALRTRRSLAPSEENKLEIGSLISKLAQVELYKENFEEAAAYIDEAEALFSSVRFTGKRAALSACLYLKGTIERANGNLAEAQELFSSALSTSDPNNLPPRRMNCVPALLALGGLALQFGNVEEAAPYFERAHYILVARGREIHPLNVAALQGLRHVLDSEGESEEIERLDVKISGILTQLDYLSDGILFNDPFPRE